MIKYLLCWRLILGRMSNVFCIVSVMLGVATLIVVNSLMGGFRASVRERLQGNLADLSAESTSAQGFADAADKVAKVQSHEWLGERVEATCVVLECLGMLQLQLVHPDGEPGPLVSHPVRLIGCDLDERVRLGNFHEHLIRQGEAAKPTFHNTDDSVDPQGIIASAEIAHAVPAGASVLLATVRGERAEPVCRRFTIVDHYRWPGSPIQMPVVWMPLQELQQMRGMPGRVTSLRIKLKDYVRDGLRAKCELASLFGPNDFQIQTWEDGQHSLLTAIAWESGILNVMLFLVLCVAAFSILAIFGLLVGEKRSAIGVLKAFGASGRGILLTFLSYGAALGSIGAALGIGLGTALSAHMNELSEFVAVLMGHGGGRMRIYFWTFYFDGVPTNLRLFDVLVIGGTAIGLAALFSAVPAWRAARMATALALRND